MKPSDLQSMKYPREHAIEFATWYSGTNKAKVSKAYERFLKESNKQNHKT